MTEMEEFELQIICSANFRGPASVGNVHYLALLTTDRQFSLRMPLVGFESPQSLQEKMSPNGLIFSWLSVWV